MQASQSSNPARLGLHGLSRAILVFAILMAVAMLPLVVQASALSLELAEPCPDEVPFSVTVFWSLDDAAVDRAEIRVDSSDGTLFTSASESGQSTTGNWVRPGMRFYLVEADGGRVLGEAHASLDACNQEAEARVEESPATVERTEPRSRREREPSISPPTAAPSSRPPAILEPTGRIELAQDEFLRLSPPRLRFCGQPVEKAMVRVLWDVSDLEQERVRIYLDSPGGQLLVDGPARGEEITGEWVTDGMRFLLYLPERGEVVAERQFRILPCSVAEYPDEPVDD